jgi:hypothetical protein
MKDRPNARSAARLLAIMLPVGLVIPACGSGRHAAGHSPASAAHTLAPLGPVDVGALWNLLVTLPSAERGNIVNALEPDVRDGLQAITEAIAGAALAG